MTRMELEFDGEIIEWRGPAPFLFVALPEEAAGVISDSASILTYGWGCISTRAVIGDTEFTTSLFPRDGGYLLPVKVAVQRAEDIDLGDVVHATIHLEPRV